jgi:hypothetical protein
MINKFRIPQKTYDVIINKITYDTIINNSIWLNNP